MHELLPYMGILLPYMGILDIQVVNPRNWKAHFDSHNTARTQACSVCGKKFKQPQTRNRHERQVHAFNRSNPQHSWQIPQVQDGIVVDIPQVHEEVPVDIPQVQEEVPVDIQQRGPENVEVKDDTLVRNCQVQDIFC